MYIFVCLTLMFSLMFLRRKSYGVKGFLVPLLMISVAVMGLLGTRIMFFLENGAWYGKSFFGALLFFPILLLPVSWVFRIHLTDLLDYATPPGLAMLAMSKWNCLEKGCCGGKVLWYSAEGVPTHFPSQIVELCVAVLIMLLLLFMERKNLHRRSRYAVCLVVYGVLRFILNYFRWEQPEYVLGMAPGAFWSIVAILIGFSWVMVARRRRRNRR